MAHPGVSDRPDLHKERHFLSRFGSEPFDEAEIARYHGWFPRIPGTLAGEWTPDYLWFPWVPRLLDRAAPEARLLVILRDPVERFCSGVAHQLRNGAKRTGATVAEAIERGFYDRQLAAWKSSSDNGRMLVLQYEMCVRDPESQVIRTYGHLGLDDDFRPENLERRVNETSASIVIDDDVRGAPRRSVRAGRRRPGRSPPRARLGALAEFRQAPSLMIASTQTVPGSDPFVAVVVALVILFLGLRVSRRVAKVQGDQRFVKLLMFSLVLHILCAPAQIFIVDHLYNGIADYTSYVNRGAFLAENLRSGLFSFSNTRITGITGNNTVYIISGLIQTVLGPDKLAEFVFCSGIAFFGEVCFLRAFSTTFPEVNPRRYAILLFFLPSLLFWTADISKETVMTVALGLAAWGAARVLMRAKGGYRLLFVGVAIGIIFGRTRCSCFSLDLPSPCSSGVPTSENG